MESNNVSMQTSSELEQEIKNYHHTRISDAAYYKAESRGFIPGFELDDWLSAENDCKMYRYN